MLPGTLTSSRKREHVLWCTLRSSMNACTCIALQERIIRKAVAHPRRMCCKTLFPLNACCIIMPSVCLEMLDTEILVGCYEFRAPNYSTVVVFSIMTTGWIKAWATPFKVGLVCRPVCCELIQQCASAHCLFTHSCNHWKIKSHRQQASCSSGPKCM